MFDLFTSLNLFIISLIDHLPAELLSGVENGDNLFAWKWDHLFDNSITFIHSQYHKGFDDRFHDVRQIVQENGFGYERYNIPTKDGYILGLDRVLPQYPCNDNVTRPVVLL